MHELSVTREIVSIACNAASGKRVHVVINTYPWK